MDLGWFRARKKALGITDDKIAVEVGRERSVINKVLSGKSPFKIEMLAPLAAALDVSKEELLFRFGLLDHLPPEPEPAPEPPSVDVLEAILADALFGVPPGTALAAYPNLVAPELREQLGLYLAGQISQPMDQETCVNTGAQPAVESEPAGQDISRR